MAAFTGVLVLTVAACQASAEAAYPSPIHALLYFCVSRHQLTLNQPVVQNVQLALAASAAAGPPASSSNNSGGGWHQSILAFGGSVNASITGGMFSDNNAGTLMVVGQQAVLVIANSTFRRSKSVSGGEQAAARRQSLSTVGGARTCTKELFMQAFNARLVLLDCLLKFVDLVLLHSSSKANNLLFTAQRLCGALRIDVMLLAAAITAGTLLVVFI
jgi:hypothetical protein